MIASFKNFIQNETDKFSLFVEEEGMSATKMEFPITQPLANLLSLIPSNTLKARALNWIVTEGLMQASKGREKLLEQVRKEMQNSLKSNFPPKNIPSRMAMQSEMAREVMHKSDENVKSQDLFSQEAWERLPLLEDITIEGSSIPDYYEENYEPKFMELSTVTNKSGQIVIDLKELAKILNDHGLKPFKYGGFDGYIQHVEKGEYLPDSRKRSAFSANNQQGLDLRPERKFVKGKQVIVDDLKGYNKKKTDYVYNFHGGSTAVDDDRAKDAISVLRAAFASIAEKIDDPNHEIWKKIEEKGREEEEENRKKIVAEIEKWKKLKEKGNIKAINYDDNKDQKEGMFKKLGLNKGSLPDFMSKEDFEFIIVNGLAEIQKGNYKNYQNIGQSEDGAGFKDFTGRKSKDELDKGEYLVDGENVYYRFSKEQIKDILEIVKSNFPKIILQIKFTNIESLKNMITRKLVNSVYEITNKNMTILLETQFNNGYKFIKDHPDERAKNVVLRIKNILNKFHTYEGQDYHKFILDKKIKKIKVNPFDNTDPQIIIFKNAGFKWDMTNFSKKEKKQQKPIYEESFKTLESGKIQYKSYRLKNAQINFSIVNEKNEKDEYFLFFPLNKTSGGVKPSSYGKSFGNTMLASPDNYLFNAGEMGKHITQNPLSEKDFAIFFDDLNKKNNYNYLTAPFVESAIKRAAYKLSSKHEELRNSDSGKLEEIKQDAKSQVWEGIKAFSGDRAFHVGFLNDKELTDKESDRLAMPIKDELRKITNDERFINYIIYWLYKVPFKGIGIDWSDLDNKIRPKIGNKADDILEKIKEAVEKNANEGRARLLSKYLFSEMERDYKKELKHKLTQSTTGKDDVGDADFSDDDHGLRPNYRDSDWGIEGYKGHEEIATLLNIDRDAEGDPYVNPNAPKTRKKRKKIRSWKKKLDAQQVTNPQQVIRSWKQKANALQKVESNNVNLFKDYKTWMSLREMTGSFAVSTNKKPKDGDGWNWWGAKGDKSGISISGEVDDVKTNPTGKKNAKKR